MNTLHSGGMRKAIMLGLALSLIACGGPATPQIRTTAFLEGHEFLFENGLDLIVDPGALEGTWLNEWRQQLDRRVQEADVIALVTVNTVRVDTDLERRQTIRLVATPDRFFVGADNVQEGDLVLSAREGETGYGTLESQERQVLNTQFFAFIKWKEVLDGQVQARWHLTPVSAGNAEQVRDLLAERRQVERDEGTRTVVIHRE